jgi:hypothetical protein
VSYNDTGVAQDLTVNRRVAAQISKPLVVRVGVEGTDGFLGKPLALVDLRNLKATMLNFVRIEGDYVVKRRTNGDFLMSSPSATLKLMTGSDLWGAGIVGAQFGILVESSGGLAFHASAARLPGKSAEESGIYLKLPDSIGRVSVDRVSIDFNNTGHRVDEAITLINSGGVGQVLSLQVPSGSRSQPFMQLEMINLQAFLGPRDNEFFELSGDFAFKSDRGAITGLTRNASVALKVGSNELSVRNATAGIVIDAEGGVAFDGSGTPTIRLSGLVDATAKRLRFGWNSTGAAVTQVVSIGEVNVAFDLPVGTQASPYVVVIAEGF